MLIGHLFFFFQWILFRLKLGEESVLLLEFAETLVGEPEIETKVFSFNYFTNWIGALLLLVKLNNVYFGVTKLFKAKEW